MTTTAADDALLLAYVDGDLSPQQCRQVEQMMEDSPEVAERVSYLMASSSLPYAEAFARQNMPPVPDSLLKKIESLSGQAAPSEHVVKASKEPLPSANFINRLFGRPRLGWLAVAFVTGATCYGLVLQAGFLGNLSTVDSQVRAPAVAQSQASPWVQQAASYQRLYSRETVDLVTPEPRVVAQTVNEIRQTDGLALRIPDLSKAGLTFKGVQRLRFNNKALVQLIYLPTVGSPIALCVMKEPKPDQPPEHMTVAAMSVVVWRQSELGYALIGEPGGVDLGAVVRMIADHSTGQLFAVRPVPLWIADAYE